MSRIFHRSLLWGDFLEILSFLAINDVYRSCGCLNRVGFIAFRRERASRQCPFESVSPSRFLSSGLNHQKILLVSYPRSGNSFLRRLLESSIGIVTGSDSRPNRTLSESLLRCGFKGRTQYSFLIEYLLLSALINVGKLLLHLLSAMIVGLIDRFFPPSHLTVGRYCLSSLPTLNQRYVFHMQARE